MARTTAAATAAKLPPIRPLPPRETRAQVKAEAEAVCKDPHVLRAFAICNYDRRQFAEVANVSYAMACQIVSGERRVGPRAAAHIERGTKGQVTRVQLRPDLFDL